MSSKLKKMTSMDFLNRISNKWLRYLIMLLLFLESTTLFLYMINTLFAGFVNIFSFHAQMYQSLLRSSTLARTMVWAVPISMTAIGAAYNERAGVINIGLEGIMTWGAWTAIYFTFITGNPWNGFVMSIIIGMVIATVHAIFTITFKGDQIVVGVAINLMAAGMTAMLTALIWQPGRSDQVRTIPNLKLYDAPFIGPLFQLIRFKNYFSVPVIGQALRYIPDPIEILNGQNLLIFVGLSFIPLTHLLLFRTPTGLRLRVTGEHPQAVATAGINVYLYQYFAVIFSGALAGLGGGMVALDVGTFADNIVRGLGFIALVAMIFGKWTVKGSVQASFFFGYFITLGIILPINGSLSSDVPPPIINMIPYLIALFGVAGFIGRSRPPKHIGKPYDPSEE